MVRLFPLLQPGGLWPGKAARAAHPFPPPGTQMLPAAAIMPRLRAGHDRPGGARAGRAGLSSPDAPGRRGLHGGRISGPPLL